VDVGDRAVAGGGEVDQHRAPVGGVGPAGHQAALHEPVDDLGRRPRGDAQPLGEVGEAQCRSEADDELWRVLESAQIADLVATLPGGLDTVVGARGRRFSGGEKQRFAIARTLLRDPRVLVRDGATSALDNDTERELQAALAVVTRGRTTITIAHRLSTIEGADQIAVLSGGQVVETGTHTELLAAGGRYARLAGADHAEDRQGRQSASQSAGQSASGVVRTAAAAL